MWSQPDPYFFKDSGSNFLSWTQLTNLSGLVDVKFIYNQQFLIHAKYQGFFLASLENLLAFFRLWVLKNGD
jgi:hypothetical protein